MLSKVDNMGKYTIFVAMPHGRPASIYSPPSKWTCLRPLCLWRTVIIRSSLRLSIVFGWGRLRAEETDD
jgi:hypothetical protein